MPPVFAYVRRIIHEPEGVQEDAIRSYCGTHGLVVVEWFTDEQSTREAYWLDRPAGPRLRLPA